MTFEEYLTKRRVNVAAFAAGEPARFAEWQVWYGQMHPESFYMLVKMTLNDVRRKFWLAEVPKPVATTSETAATVRPAGRRAAVARPAETVKAEVPATELAKPAETAASEETAAKPARPVFKPRAIIRKPTETTVENIASPEISEAEKPTGVQAQEPKPETEKPEAAPAKPVRPRAVIKRPAALTNPENASNENPDQPMESASETAGDSIGKSAAENPPETPKPARPRPVFKRPTAAAIASENNSAETGKTPGETLGKPGILSGENSIESPVAKPGQEGASEAKAVADEIHQNPEAAKAAEEIAAAAGHVPKPSRPRPVFKRPSARPTTENLETETEKTPGETTRKPEENAVEAQSGKSAETVGDSAEKPVAKSEENPSERVANPEGETEEPAPKSPRPRPVFKRPAKPDDSVQ